MPPKKRPKRGAAAPKKATPKRATRAGGRGRDPVPEEEVGGDDDEELREAMKRSLSETNREESELQAAIRYQNFV